MSNSNRLLARIDDYLRVYALIRRGASFRPSQDSSHWSLLIGSAGNDFFDIFEGSDEYHDFCREPHAHANPLDRWSTRIISGLCDDLKNFVNSDEHNLLYAVYPFNKNPSYPFQHWALLAEKVFYSPLGLLIHPRYGLWHAYRGALFFDSNHIAQPHESAQQSDSHSPCDDCRDKPCLHACPVHAFTHAGYDTQKCTQHLANPTNNCFATACLARRACPIAKNYAYKKQLSEFLLQRFYQSWKA